MIIEMMRLMFQNPYNQGIIEENVFYLKLILTITINVGLPWYGMPIVS